MIGIFEMIGEFFTRLWLTFLACLGGFIFCIGALAVSTILRREQLETDPIVFSMGLVVAGGWIVMLCLNKIRRGRPPY